MATSPKHSYIRLLCLLCIIFLGIFLLRLGFLMLFNQNTSKSYNNPQVASQVVRGTIYDRNQRILAIQTPYWGVYLHLNAIKDMQLVSEVIAPFVQMNPQEIQNKAQSYTTYAQIKERIDDRMVQPLLDAIQKYSLRGQVNVEKRMGRTYPAQFHASQIIGFTNTEGYGIEGIELSEEAHLNPYPEIGTAPVTYGQDITLTLDLDIQYALDVQLQQIADQHNPDYAMAIVLDAVNADILGMGSYPWYDINNLSASKTEQRRNNAVNLLYEPGSVFKLFSLAAVLKAGQAQTSETFDCDGSYTFQAGASRITVNCTAVHGEVDERTMISKSCNGAIVHWALQTDAKAFYDILTSFGFNRSYDIGLPSRARSQIAPPSTWSGRSQATISFGQELLTSALHLATAATALCPSGELLQPNLILRRTSPVDGSILYERERMVIQSVLDSETTSLIRSGMLMATEDGGTGVRARVAGVDVGVKTGTAQILNPLTNSYEDGTVLASTLAMVPIDNPKYIIYIGAGNPKGDTIWGSNIAAPAVANLVQSLVSQGKLKAKDTEVR